MNKKKAMLYATGAFAAFMLVIAVFALTGFTFVQDLTVPEASTIVVYQSDGATVLDNGAALSSLWGWNERETRFELVIVVENTGTTDVTTAVSSKDVPSGWTLSSSGLGLLTSGASQTVNIYLANATASPGANTGSWHFTVSAT